MSEPSPRPFDPAEFTAEELQLARQILLGLRRSPPQQPPVTRTVRQGHSIEWRKTPSGGEARLVSCTVTQSYGPHVCHTDFLSGPPLTDWLPCPNRRDAETLFELPPPDHIAEGPPPGGDG